MKTERVVKVYGQRCVNWESEQNPEQSTPVHQSVKVSIEFKVFPGRKKDKVKKRKYKQQQQKSNKKATKPKRKGILELQDQKQIWKELSEASHAEVLNVCTWEDERTETSPLSLGALLMPVSMGYRVLFSSPSYVPKCHGNLPFHTDMGIRSSGCDSSWNAKLEIHRILFPFIHIRLSSFCARTVIQ